MITAAEIHSLLIKMLVGAAGGQPRHWREVIGEVVVWSLATHPRCNWTVVPDGSAVENDAVYQAVELVRQEHPLVSRNGGSR